MWISGFRSGPPASISITRVPAAAPRPIPQTPLPGPPPQRIGRNPPRLACADDYVIRLHGCLLFRFCNMTRSRGQRMAEIRAVRPSDLDDLYRICLATGACGED